MGLRGAAFAGAMGLLVVVAVELVSLGVHWLAFGSGFSYADAQAARRAVASGAPPPGAVRAPTEQDENNLQALHPYVGYVLDPRRSGNWNVNDYGFLGDPPPFGDDRPEAVSVALLGGSVAENLGVFASQRLLEEIAQIPAFRGREVGLSLMALRGMKQPQQLFAIEWLLSLGARFDIVINLDGFNEIVLAGENAMQGTSPFYPRRWGVRVAGMRRTEDESLLGEIRFLESLRQDGARRFSGWIVRWSITANVIQRWTDDRLVSRLDTLRTRLNRSLLLGPLANRYEATGPAREHEDLLARSRDLASYWKRTSILLAERARSSGFRYFHFLQPNQWVEGSKIFGEEERDIATPDDYFHREAAISGYRELIAASAEIQAAGAAFTDLTMLFRGVEEPLYTDACCHLNERGYTRIAESIGRTIREAYASERRRRRR
jgi:hypothetical protein